MSGFSFTPSPAPSLAERDACRTRLTQLYSRRKLVNTVVLIGLDILAWMVVVAAVSSLTRLWGRDSFDETWSLAMAAGYFSYALVKRLIPGWGLGAVKELRHTVQALGLGAVVIGVALALGGGGWSSLLYPIATTLVAIPALAVSRRAAKALLIRRGLWGVPTVIYGAAQTGRRVVQALRAEPGLGYWPVAFLDDDPEKIGQTLEGIPVSGGTSTSPSGASVAIFAMPGIHRSQLVAMLDGPLSVYRHVIIIPDLFDVQSLWVEGRDLGGVLGLHLHHNLALPAQRRLKRASDLVLTLLAAPLWLPLCGLIALLIWLDDRASPLYGQARSGLDERAFTTWKFRTMTPNAEAVLQRHLAESPELRREWEEHFKLRHDPRITRVGGLLRKTSLDELPQLLNVLRGEMSLVGPRPLPQYHLEGLPSSVRQLRREVRPGLTGLWQVSGRSDAGNEGMSRHDPYYVRNWSIWLDIVILTRTIRVVLRRSGAY